jgi:hypothetical protein
MKIGFNRNTVLFGIIAICSVVLIIYGATGVNGAKSIKSITDLERSDIKKGQFVDLSELEIVPYYTTEDGSTVSNEVRSTTVGLSIDRDYVLAALKDNGYMYVMLKNPTNGSTSDVKDTEGLVGEISGASSKLPDRDVYALKDSDTKITEMVIKEFDLDKRKAMLIPGIFLFLLSAVMIVIQKPY